MKLLLIALFAIAVNTEAQTWPHEPKTYKNLEWGTPEAVAEVELRLQTCSDYRLWRRCYGKGNIGDVYITHVLFFDKEGLAAVMIFFPSDSYETIRGAFTEKYGPAMSKKDSIVSNRMGAQFEQETLTWFGEKVLITLNRYGSKLDQGNATIGLKAFIEALEGISNAEQKEAADDL